MGRVRPLELLLTELGKWVQAAAEQRSHLLRDHRITGGQAIDPIQAETDPRSWRLTRAV
jgi:hypothetical protein